MIFNRNTSKIDHILTPLCYSSLLHMTLPDAMLLKSRVDGFFVLLRLGLRPSLSLSL